MAYNPTTNANQFLTEVFSAELRDLAAQRDRAYLGLDPVPGIVRVSLPPGALSDTVKVPLVDFGSTEAVQTAEGTAATVADLSDAAVTLTPAPYVRAVRLDTLGYHADPEGAIPKIVRECVEGVQGAVTRLIAGLSASGTNTTAATTTLTIDDVYAAIAALEQRGGKPAFMILHPKQVQDLRASMRAETGALAQQVDSRFAALLQAFGVGAWQVLGLPVFVSSRVPSTGSPATDYQGMLVGENAIAFAMSAPLVPQVGAAILARDELLGLTIEADRRGLERDTAIVGHSYVAAAIAQQAAVQVIESDV